MITFICLSFLVQSAQCFIQQLTQPQHKYWFSQAFLQLRISWIEEAAEFFVIRGASNNGANSVKNGAFLEIKS